MNQDPGVQGPRTAAEYRGHNLVFVVGSPRSGTTWLQRLLAAHPGVRTGQESKVFRSYVAPQLRAWRWELTREGDARTATGRGGTGMSCYLKEEEFLAILREYMLRLLQPMIGALGPGELFVEKTPAHALSLAEIGELLPDSRIVHVLRDPRDVVSSLVWAHRGWGAGWAPASAAAAAATWVKHVRAVRESATARDRRRFLEVTYEDLWQAPVRTLDRVASFLGLDWAADRIEAAVRANAPEHVRAGGGSPIPLAGEAAARGGGEVVLDPPEFVRRGGPGGWRTDLNAWEKLQVRWVAGAMMREAGYEWGRERTPDAGPALTAACDPAAAPRAR